MNRLGDERLIMEAAWYHCGDIRKERLVESLALIDDLKGQLNEIPVGDVTRLDAFKKRATMIATRVFPQDRYAFEIQNASFYPRAVAPRTVMQNSATPEKLWENGRTKVLSILNTMEEDLKLFSGTRESDSVVSETKERSNKVFIVHGHDDEMKVAVARLLEQLGLDTIILHEQPNKGKTIIEKFSNYADVGFAVVLLSADDVGRAKNASESAMKYRARQNVIMELGYFLGRLGRENVAALYRPGEDFEIPSDFSGVLYTEYDRAGHWRFSLVQELKASGYDVDANKLIRR
jgi:predicted nucleotide-binding protein